MKTITDLIVVKLIKEFSYPAQHNKKTTTKIIRILLKKLVNADEWSKQIVPTATATIVAHLASVFREKLLKRINVAFTTINLFKIILPVVFSKLLLG